MTKLVRLAALAVSLTTALSVAGCWWHHHRDCREHESWDGNVCHADHGYEHYWDHDDHRDWHPEH
jgi:G:T-mismatch repair DNA endonuclease (very short patch repair protein)